MASVELDWYHENHKRTVKQACTKHKVKATLLQENGPAGGNPLYKFEGTREALVSLIKAYDGDNGEWEFLAEGITD